MKFVFVLIMTLITSSSFAAKSVYEGQSIWNDSEEFSQLELSGIALDAIQVALNRCHAAGNKRCFLKSIFNKQLNEKKWSNRFAQERYFTHINAIVGNIGNIRAKSLKDNMYIVEEISVNDKKLDPIAVMGVQMNAINKALYRCYLDKKDYCAIVNSEATESNTRFRDEVEQKDRYKTSAHATVEGF